MTQPLQQQPWQPRLSLFQNLQAASSRTITLDEMYRLVRYDSHVEAHTDSYRKMARALGKAKADSEVKQRLLPAVSLAVLFNGSGRKATHVVEMTGLALVDIDHVGDTDEAFRRITSDSHTLMAYRTVSGEGLRIVYRYRRQATDRPPARPAKGTERPAAPSGQQPAILYPAAFRLGNQYYAQLTGLDYDAQCADYGRLCGLAHDAHAYYNPQAEPFCVSDDDILATSFASERESGKARQEHPTGTFTTDADEAWQRIEPALLRRGLSWQPGHHHDYAMHAAFLFNRYGADLDDVLRWAAQQWADYDARQREATIRSCYRHTSEHGTWRLNRHGRRAKETSMITLPEVRQWLTDHVEVVFNEVTDQTMWRPTGHGQPSTGHARPPQRPTGEAAPADCCGEDGWQLLDERVVCSMRAQMAADTGKRVLKNDVMDVLHSDFARLYHPIRQYIAQLPPWDGTDRIGLLCRKVHTDPSAYAAGPHGQPLLPWAFHKWLAACVATWMNDGATNHQIMVLIGPQGVYKTTFFRYLLPPPLRAYFWENNHNSFQSKDDHIALAENCLVEIEEIDLQGQRDIAELKALATSDHVKERRPYARFRDEKHRLASFCATGNLQHFLCDDTGNRRWLCFLVTHIDDPRQWDIDYEQLYAQLRDELAQGFRYWFNACEQRIVERQNQHFRIESDEEQLIRTRLRPPGPTDKVTLMNAANILQFINGGTIGRGLSTRKIGAIMQRLGFKLVHSRQGNFYSVFQIPPDQIQTTIAMDSDESHNSQNIRAEEAELPF